MTEEEKKEFLIEFGHRVKELRTALSMSQDELAKKCGYTSRSTINKIELGINNIPQSKIKVIAEALKVSPCNLLKIEKELPVTSKQSLHVTLESQIEQQYGASTLDCITLYAQLDEGDQGEIRGTMKQMLKADKYIAKKSESKQAI